MTKRLGMYFLGVAIGLVLVGFLMTTRHLMVQGSGGQESPARGTP